MIRRPPRSTLSSSSAASDVYKRQVRDGPHPAGRPGRGVQRDLRRPGQPPRPVSYTHLRAHETPEHLVCRLLLEKKKTKKKKTRLIHLITKQTKINNSKNHNL